MTLNGLGTARSREGAIRWCQLGAEHNIVEAQFDLANLFGLAGNYDLAFYWYKRSADQGYAPSKYRLGLLYQLGSGVHRDEGRAIQLFQEAASAGHLFAQQKLNKRLFFESEGMWGRIRSPWYLLRDLWKAMVIFYQDEQDPRIRE